MHTDPYDLQRFLQSMQEFNTVEPIGSIYENSFIKNELGHLASKSLVDIICYCIHSTHYHLLLCQTADEGIEKYMHKVGSGFTKYLNHKYNQRGHLFEGPFKAAHVDSNEYLLHLSVYINLNDKVHRLGNRVSKSSWKEYMEAPSGKNSFCKKGIILQQFASPTDYKKFAEEALPTIQERQDLKHLLFD